MVLYQIEERFEGGGRTITPSSPSIFSSKYCLPDFSDDTKSRVILYLINKKAEIKFKIFEK